jgi:hypothetical protein
MRELSGAIAVSAVLQAAIGYLGEWMSPHNNTQLESLPFPSVTVFNVSSAECQDSRPILKQATTSSFHILIYSPLAIIT